MKCSILVLKENTIVGVSSKLGKYMYANQD